MRSIIGRRAFLAGAVSVSLFGPALADEAKDGVVFAEQQLKPYSAKPVFVAPGVPFDAKACAAGKTMLSMPNSSANPFLKGIIDRMKRVGAEIGLKVVEWENQGQPSQWVQGVEFAIRDKVSMIDLISGIDPKTIEPQVKAAKAAGIKVMTSHFYDPSQLQDPLVSSSLTIGFNRSRQDPRRLGDRPYEWRGECRAGGKRRSPADGPSGERVRGRTDDALPGLQDQQEDQRRRDRVGHEDTAFGAGGSAGRPDRRRGRPDL